VPIAWAFYGDTVEASLVPPARPYRLYAASAASARAGSSLMRYTVCRISPVSLAICATPAVWFPSIARAVSNCTRVAWFPAEIGAAVVGPGVRDSGPLSGFRRFRLCGSVPSRHKVYQRVPQRLVGAGRPPLPRLPAADAGPLDRGHRFPYWLQRGGAGRGWPLEHACGFLDRLVVRLPGQPHRT
jgi:hypothetical protein